MVWRETTLSKWARKMGKWGKLNSRVSRGPTLVAAESLGLNFRYTGTVSRTNESNVVIAVGYSDTESVMQPNESRPAPVSGATAVPVEPPREKRLNIAVPVKLFLDAAGNKLQLCCSYEIAMVG